MQISGYLLLCILALTKATEETTKEENVSDTTEEDRDTEKTTTITTTTTEDPITTACVTDNTVRHNKIQIKHNFSLLLCLGYNLPDTNL